MNNYLLIFQDILGNQEIPIKLLNKIKKKYNVTIIDYFFNNIKSDNIFSLENLTFNNGARGLKFLDNKCS